jgi:hypothetical protein
MTLIPLVLLSVAIAQATPPVPRETSVRRELSAVRVDQAPEIDGRVLDDPVWQPIAASEDFRQNTPDEGAAASERTLVRVIYTADTLYVGVVCFDRDPSSIVVSDSRRDAPLVETDSFQILLDTFHDRQSGFVFGTNPAGIEYDAQVSNDGERGNVPVGGTQQSGSGGGFNLNWDGAWRVETLVAEFGWSAEFAIPFRTLRYPAGAGQPWGINFQRNIRRRNERAFWSALSRQYEITRVSHAGLMTGLELPPRRDLKLMPYALGRALHTRGTADTDFDRTAGMDVKLGVTPSLTLDLTVNTDFAQVEVDQQQVNLDRFNLFFPEKRPFFLENAGLFAVGSSGEAELFFSRRIGINDEGFEIPILAGARLSGKVGATEIGLLNMQTDDMRIDENDRGTPMNNFTVARVQRNLPNRSGAGAIFVNRQGTGRLAAADDYNRAVGVDGRWGIGRYGLVSGFAARTDTPGLDGRAHAVQFGGRYNSPALDIESRYSEVGEDFNPEVGFLSREDGFRKLVTRVFHTRRIARRSGLHEVRPHATFQGFWNFSGFQETGLLHLDSHWEWKNGHEIHTGMNLTREGVVQGFEIYPGVMVPPGTYDHREAQLVAFTNEGAPASIRGELRTGGFFGGSRVSPEITLRLRNGEKLVTEIAWESNDVDLPWGDFVANLGRFRASYSFTPRVFVQALLQYNDRADLWSTNLRLGWLQQANTGLFVVYNDRQDLGLGRNTVAGRTFVVKYSRLFDLFGD